MELFTNLFLLQYCIFCLKHLFLGKEGSLFLMVEFQLLKVEGQRNTESDHLGKHYSNSSFRCN